MADDKTIIENRIASLKKLRDRSINQVTVAVYDAEIAALEKEMEKPAPKKKEVKKKKGEK
jgi:hypothetical protein